jgi:hypothetical protein
MFSKSIVASVARTPAARMPAAVGITMPTNMLWIRQRDAAVKMPEGSSIRHTTRYTVVWRALAGMSTLTLVKAQAIALTMGSYAFVAAALFSIAPNVEKEDATEDEIFDMVIISEVVSM